ncbi:TPA: Tn3 family transposase [Salmonella enterica]|uniref:Transposase n=1 Tax=Salmonella enterica TaxID=28901 RepID=A0A759H345_SALER|nr:transposase [Salmonella enterica]HAG5358947.1 transposase [Salmonella enterica]HDN7459750.1 Tn3 family transposase [Salmonella enterica subsp. enterica serovar Eastbourne]HDN7576802.1 Tn3 family transposase [Salmonella enterica subsp. enterica serovar Eastbourne]
MMKKLASYPKQNGLAKALREIGRIERTLFMLDWFRDPGLRRRVQARLKHFILVILWAMMRLVSRVFEM